MISTAAVQGTDQADDAWRAFRGRSRFANLDGLRCLSIAAVIWHHGPGFGRTDLLGSGQTGVTLFFAISGFLITTLLLRERRHGAISLRGFYIRRSLRIMPLYFAVLGLYVVLVGLTSAETPAGRTFFGNLPYFVTYTSNWFVGGAGTFGFAWSLATEEQFYATWPLALRYLGVAAGAGLLSVVLAIVIGFHLLGHQAAPAGPLWLTILLSIQMAICWGCLVGVGLDSRAGFRVASRVLGHRHTPVVLLALVAATLSISGTSTVPVHLLLAALVASCVIREDNSLAAILRLPLFVKVGAVSYGMYLLHGLVYNVLDVIHARYPSGWDAHGLTGFVLAFAATTGVASVCFRYVETPFLRLKSRFGARAV